MLPATLIPLNEWTVGALRPSVTLTPSSAGEGKGAFEAVLLDRPMYRRKPLDWLISVGIHALIAALAVVPPFLFTQQMDRVQYSSTALIAPPMGLASPGLPHQIQNQHRSVNPANLAMPVAIPKAIPASQHNDGPPDLFIGSIGGVVGGLPDGVLGGILGGAGTAPPPPAVIPSNKPLQVGREVAPPQLVSGPPPVYPRQARAAQVQGDVQIEAVVSEDGNVIHMRVLNGPPMLIAAALQAVGQWRYQPTCLNGVPYRVQFTVNVAFRLLPTADEAWGYVIA